MVKILLLLLASAFSLQPSALRETLRPVGALPAHVAGSFEELTGCHLTPDDDYLVFDRRGHAVYRVARNGAAGARKILQIGVEPGRILGPIAFASSPDGTFIVADAPGGQERIQIFSYLGASLGGFWLPVRSVPRVTLGDLVLSGVGSVDYTGRTILVSQPDITGALITEYATDGRTLRTFGNLRKTGHEGDRDLHLALNGGLPLAIHGGGFYYIFIAGVPAFRKYNPKGELLFERHIEGLEIDEHVRALPTTWPRRKTRVGEFPLVPSVVRTAAVDPSGSLWISLASPHTYVYDSDGDKRRVVQFHGAGVFPPSDLFFTKEGRLIVAPGCYVFDVAIPGR
jgi:hypothetical protein